MFSKIFKIIAAWFASFRKEKSPAPVLTPAQASLSSSTQNGSAGSPGSDNGESPAKSLNSEMTKDLKKLLAVHRHNYKAERNNQMLGELYVGIKAPGTQPSVDEDKKSVGCFAGFARLFRCGKSSKPAPVVVNKVAGPTNS
jgi:hypothetical protein